MDKENFNSSVESAAEHIQSLDQVAEYVFQELKAFRANPIDHPFELEQIAKKYGGRLLGQGRNALGVVAVSFAGRETALKFYSPHRADWPGKEAAALKIAQGNDSFVQLIDFKDGEEGRVGYVAKEVIAGKQLMNYDGWNEKTDLNKKIYLENYKNNILAIPDEHWDKVIEMIQFANANNISVDMADPANILYDDKRGFVALDYATHPTTANYDLQSTVRSIVGAGNEGIIGAEILSSIDEKIKAAIKRVAG